MLTYLVPVAGMSDGLTDHLVHRARSSSPFVLKYLPYGNLSEVGSAAFLTRFGDIDSFILGNAIS